MRQPDDSTLTEYQLRKVQREAMRALVESSSLGIFPTPVDQIMSVAGVEEVHEDVLNPSFIEKIRAELGKTGDVLKRAAGKVLGLFDARDSLVFIDRSLLRVKQTFVRLHEAAHGFIPWQRPMYAVVEDCKEALEPDVAEVFDREANVFASEVLFQGNAFIEEASSSKFGVFVPVNLSKKYGASIYASIRQYVSKSHYNCAVLVLNKPEFVEGDGFTASLRRSVQSTTFSEMFGMGIWPELFTPDDQIGALVPLGRARASRPRDIRLTDANGEQHQFIAEAFTQTYQVFVLMHHVKALTANRVFLTPTS